MVNPLVSVIIPTYNRSNFLKRAVKSALNQTIKDIEIIVADDSSTDDTSKVAASFTDKRVRYYLKKTLPKGGAATINFGAKKAKGKYVAILDDDDEWLKNKLEEQLKVFERNKKIILVHTGDYLIEGKTKRLNKLKKISGKVSWKDFMFKGLTTSTVMIKRSVLKHELFDEKLKCAYDREFFMRISKYGVFGFCDKPLINYTIHPGNISSKNRAKIESEIYFIKKHKNKLIEKKIIWIYFYRLGSLYFKDKNFSEARPSFIKSIKFNPFFIKSYIYLLVNEVSQILVNLGFAFNDKR